jgi:hypothetical protein
MEADPFFVGDGDIAAARALVDEARDAELFLYPGHQHLFADRTARARLCRSARDVLADLGLAVRRCDAPLSSLPRQRRA